jgi:hypothetical protein
MLRPLVFDHGIMNYWKLRRFFKASKENRIVGMIQKLMRHRVFKGARFDVHLPLAAPKKVVFLLGQVHTVWKGNIAHKDRDAIVACQSRLCSYYAYFEQFYDVREFGGEGMYEGVSTEFSDRRCFDLYERVRRWAVTDNHQLEPEEVPAVAKKMLAEIAKRWQEEVKSQKDPEQLRLLSSAVSGQTLFNYLTPKEVRVFPVEGEEAYRHVLGHVDKLGDEIRRLESGFDFKAVKQRGNKIKTEKEAKAVRNYNVKVKEFNRILKGDIRERATFELLRERLQKTDVVVFTMGVGHRKNYLRLVNRQMKGTDTAFVFITAPELLPNLWLKIGLPVLVLLALLGFWWFIG